MALSSLLNTANELAQQLGLDTWQLQQGKYHGFVFHTINTTLDIINKNFNPLDALGSSLTNVAGQFSATDGFGPDRNAFPYGTNIQAMNTDNAPRKKYVINRLPNGRDNIQYLGYSGEDINFNILLWGMSYDSIIRQLQAVYLNDKQYIGKPDFRKLYHPIYGVIPDCHFLEYKITYMSEKWRASIITLYFHSEQPISTSNISVNPTLSSQITSILNTINSLNNTWNNVTYLLGTVGNLGGSIGDGGSNPKSSSNLGEINK